MDRLRPDEREFLELVSAAAFANPFGDDRVDIDLRIAGSSPGASRNRQLESALERVRRFLQRFREDHATLDAFPDEDRPLVRYAHLFDIFHEFADDLDGFISRQAGSEESCPVPFAGDFLNRLVSLGFSPVEARRDLAMLYQLRRAYYFIDSSLVGTSSSMKRLRLALWNSVFTHDIRLYEQHLWDRMEDFSTLLLGETGTGKGAAAAAIGRSGYIPFDEKHQRFTESFIHSFISINLSQFPEGLIESELFGHRKGAFTGAIEAYEGVFSRCSRHGSILLDEIGDVSVPVQIKLLQVLQERWFSPVGSHARCRFSGRVIAATNKRLEHLRRHGLIRDDFFYRLCSDVITVPTLRDRVRENPCELRDLVSLVVTRTAGHESDELVALVLDVIVRDIGTGYAWPGNVRELEQSVRRILITHSYDGDSRAVAPDLRDRLLDAIDAGTHTAAALVRDYCKLLHKRHGTYEEVARRTGLDRRTVKKHVIQETMTTPSKG